MPEQSTQTPPKADNAKVKEILEIIAKILEIRSRISQDTGDFMDLDFDIKMEELYQHYKSALYDEVKEIYKYREER